MKISKLVSLCFFFLQILAIYLFTEGFLLVREQLSNMSQKSPLDGTDFWFSQKAKVLIFIIDALRFDFFYYNQTIVGHEKYPYQNKFARLHNLMESQPENFIVFRTYADPPTVTVQRVQSMLTGNLPPFVEITENFGSSAISEDNIIKKLSKEGRNVCQIGDYIWMDLFPTEFTESFPYNSFDIRDFDSVDNGVKKHIFPQIEQNDFDLMIAHTIGLDHIGHTYDIFHEKIGEKLKEMDDLVMRIISAIDDNTVLIIMGDHGMSEEGDHGGGSPDETNTVVAAYYKRGFKKYKETGTEGVMKSMRENATQEIVQTDLAPTLAMLLGLPIPYSNTGQLINDFYINENLEEADVNKRSFGFIETIVRDNYLNMLQVSEYISVIQRDFKKYSSDIYHNLQLRYEEVKLEYQDFNNRLKDKEIKNHEHIREYGINLVKKMQALAKEVYDLVKTSNSYDFFFAVVGVLIGLLCLGLALLVIQYSHIHLKSEKLLQNCKSDIVVSDLLNILYSDIKASRFCQITIIGLVISGLKLGLMKLVALSSVLIIFRVFNALGKITSQHTKKFMGESRNTKYSVLRPFEWIFLLEVPLATTIGFSIVIFQIVIRLSVALTRLERDCLEVGILVVLAGHFIMILLKSRGQLNSPHKVRTLGTLVLLGILIGIIPYYDFFYYSKISHWNWLESYLYSSPIRIILPLLLFSQRICRKIKSLCIETVSKTKSKVLISYLHVISLITICAHYAIPVIKGEDLQHSFWVQILLPRVTYITILLTLLTGCFESLFSYPETNGLKSNGMTSHHINSKQKFYVSNAQLCLLQLMFLLAGPNGIMSFSLLYIIFELTSYYFCHTDPKLVRLLPMTLGIISFYGYFCTGHTNQVTNLQVSQGFIGFNEFNLLVSGSFVLINTMASFIMSMIFLINFKLELQEKKEFIVKIQKDKKNLWKEFSWINMVLLYMIPMTANFVATSINCLINHDSLLLIYDFAPKYLIDTAIYFFIVVCTLSFS